MEVLFRKNGSIVSNCEIHIILEIRNLEIREHSSFLLAKFVKNKFPSVLKNGVIAKRGDQAEVEVTVKAWLRIYQKKVFEVFCPN